MRYYSKRNPIILPIFPGCVFPGDVVGQIGTISHIYGIDSNGKYEKLIGVYSESGGDTITSVGGQSILDIDPVTSTNYIIITMNFHSSIGQSVTTVAGHYYYIVNDNRAFIISEEDTILGFITDTSTAQGYDTGNLLIYPKSSYSINLQDIE